MRHTRLVITRRASRERRPRSGLSRAVVATATVVMLAAPVGMPPASAHPLHVWAQHPGAGPVGRAYAAMTTDLVTGRVLMFGGCSISPCPLDTWSWNGTGWSQLSPAASPAFCPSAEMVYDSANAQTVLVCGYDLSPGGTQSQIWTYNATANTWTDRTAGTRPSGRQDYTLTYDPFAARVVLFGGRANNGPVLNDTWEWNGATNAWSLVLPNGAAGSPSPRYGAGFAYDQAHHGGESIVVAGQGPGGNAATGTWGYKALTDTWTQRATADPPARWVPTMAYDSAHAELVLHGGVNLAAGVVLSDTWTWNGTAWVFQAATGPDRYAAGMAYHAASQKMVLFSGVPAAGPTAQSTHLFG